MTIIYLARYGNGSVIGAYASMSDAKAAAQRLDPNGYVHPLGVHGEVSA